MAPLETAAPSVLTARPIQAAATIGSSAKKVRAITRQKNQLDHRKDHDQGRNHDGHDRPGANGGAGGDGGGDPANRDARRERGRPFPAVAEHLPGNQIDQRPVNEIGLDDGGQPAKHDRRGQPRGGRRLHAQRGSQDHDGGLDEPLRSRGGPQPLGDAGEEVAEEQARAKGYQVAGFARQAERPGDAEAGSFVRRGRQVGVMAEDPATEGHPEQHA